jgi:hypothetical protein
VKISLPERRSPVVCRSCWRFARRGRPLAAGPERSWSRPELVPRRTAPGNDQVAIRDAYQEHASTKVACTASQGPHRDSRRGPVHDLFAAREVRAEELTQPFSRAGVTSRGIWIARRLRKIICEEQEGGSWAADSERRNARITRLTGRARLVMEPRRPTSRGSRDARRGGSWVRAWTRRSTHVGLDASCELSSA